jgi:phosphoribosylaminoimidazolecarboxamide formyltransferase/IMP cyclohydrolase
VGAKQLHGKELSYNNLLDLDAAYSIVRGFTLPAVAVIKHNNPCGAAANTDLSLATQRALAGDPLSAFGSVLGFNHLIDEGTAKVLCEPGLFIEAIVAPGYSSAALELLTTKPKWRGNVRLLELVGASSVASAMSPARASTPTHRRFLAGGLLVQDEDCLPASPLDWKAVTKAPVPARLSSDLQFGWELVRHVKSNAIVLAKEGSLIGVGAGQMSRVDSVEIALEKAGERSHGSILASDAFFPFPDSIERAARAGIAAVIQPGGSKNDDAVIAACDEHQLPMIFTGRRHFKH